MDQLISPARLGNPSPPKQNFAKQFTPEEAARPKAHYFSFIFDAASIAAAAGLSYLYLEYLERSAPFWQLLALGAILALLNTTGFILTKSRTRRAAVLALETAGLLSFFVVYHGLKPLYIASMALAVFFFLYWGERGSRNEMENALKFKFFRSVRPMLGKFVSALVLLGVLLSLPRIEADPNFFVGKSIGDVSSWTVELAQKFYPDFKRDDTLHDLAKRLAERELEKRDPRFAALDPAMRAALLNKAADEIIKNIKAQTGANMENDGTLESALNQFIATTLTGWYQKSPTAFLFGWAVLLFFVFRGFGAIASVGIAALAFLLYQLLLAADVIHIIGESRMHESIEYS